MPATDREVFERFLFEPGTTREVALLAFASYAADKFEWMAHIEARDGQPPSDVDVARWVADLSDGRLRAIQEQAVVAFGDAARVYMQPINERDIKDAIDASILHRVEKATSFWRTLAPNLFIGIVSSFLFALLVIAAARIAALDPSMIALLTKPQVAQPQGSP